jgi:hypothetical protein
MLDADPRSCSWGGRLPLRRVASLMTVRGWACSWFPIVPEPGLAVWDDVVTWRPQGLWGFIAALIRVLLGVLFCVAGSMEAEVRNGCQSRNAVLHQFLM